MHVVHLQRCGAIRRRPPVHPSLAAVSAMRPANLSQSPLHGTGSHSHAKRRIRQRQAPNQDSLRRRGRRNHLAADLDLDPHRSLLETFGNVRNAIHRHHCRRFRRPAASSNPSAPRNWPLRSRCRSCLGSRRAASSHFSHGPQ